jgi:hypothetical protein
MKGDKPELSRKELNIYRSIEDYRKECEYSGQYPKGLLITSGPTSTILSISAPVRKDNPSKYAIELCNFYEKNRDRQLIFDRGYDRIIMELYGLMKETDGAANFDKGYLTAVKRSIKQLKHEGVVGGTRHQAAAFASTQGELKAFVLSEDMGTLSLFIGGEQFMKEPLSKLYEERIEEIRDVPMPEKKHLPVSI